MQNFLFIVEMSTLISFENINIHINGLHENLTWATWENGLLKLYLDATSPCYIILFKGIEFMTLSNSCENCI